MSSSNEKRGTNQREWILRRFSDGRPYFFDKVTSCVSENVPNLSELPESNGTEMVNLFLKLMVEYNKKAKMKSLKLSPTFFSKRLFCLNIEFNYGDEEKNIGPIRTIRQIKTEKSTDSEIEETEGETVETCYNDACVQTVKDSTFNHDDFLTVEQYAERVKLAEDLPKLMENMDEIKKNRNRIDDILQKIPSVMELLSETWFIKEKREKDEVETEEIRKQLENFRKISIHHHERVKFEHLDIRYFIDRGSFGACFAVKFPFFMRRYDQEIERLLVAKFVQEDEIEREIMIGREIGYHKNVAEMVYSDYDMVVDSDCLERFSNEIIPLKIGNGIILMKHYMWTLKTYLLYRKFERNALDYLEICYLLKGILEGVGYLNRKRICHRDLHSSNIFLEVNDRYSRVIIGDFGGSIDFGQREGILKNDMKIRKDDKDVDELLKKIDDYSITTEFYNLGDRKIPEISNFNPDDDDWALDYENTDMFCIGRIGRLLLILRKEMISNESEKTFIEEEKEQELPESQKLENLKVRMTDSEKKLPEFIELYDLIQKMLEVDPSKRVIFQEAIEVVNRLIPSLERFKFRREGREAVLIASQDPLRSNGRDDIFAIDPISEEIINLTKDFEILNEKGWYQPWEPVARNSEVVFRQFRRTSDGDYFTRLFVINFDRKSEVWELRKIEEEFNSVVDFAWSPDDRDPTFAFVEEKTLKRKVMSSSLVVITDLKVANKFQISIGSNGTKWTSDGKWICVSTKEGILFTTRDGAIQRTIPCEQRGFAIRSDCKAIALIRNGKINIVDFEGNGIRTYNHPTTNNRTEIYDWSPDSRYLTFSNPVNPKRIGPIFVLSLEDGICKEITPTANGGNYGGYFSRDSKMIAFHNLEQLPKTRKRTLGIVRSNCEGYKELLGLHRAGGMPPSWAVIPSNAWKKNI